VSGILLQPFIPHKAEELLDAMGVDATERSIDFAALGRGRVGPVTGGLRLFVIPTSDKSTISAQ
jgi:methionyl-tRNA synthetase